MLLSWDFFFHAYILGVWRMYGIRSMSSLARSRTLILSLYKNNKLTFCENEQKPITHGPRFSSSLLATPFLTQYDCVYHRKQISSAANKNWHVHFFQSLLMLFGVCKKSNALHWMPTKPNTLIYKWNVYSHNKMLTSNFERRTEREKKRNQTDFKASLIPHINQWLKWVFDGVVCSRSTSKGKRKS